MLAARAMKNILITGIPGIGKTTGVIRLAEELKDLSPAGFYTAEIREGGVRRGFEMVGLNGRRELLAHVDIESAYHVGRYGIDLRSFEFFLDSLMSAGPANKIIIIDEIGKMECLSQKFRAFVRDSLDSEKPVIATIALKDVGFITEVKSRIDVKLVEMTVRNRDALPAEIGGYVLEILKVAGQGTGISRAV